MYVYVCSKHTKQIRCVTYHTVIALRHIVHLNALVCKNKIARKSISLSVWTYCTRCERELFHPLKAVQPLSRSVPEIWVGILTLRRAITELSRFSLCVEHIQWIFKFHFCRRLPQLYTYMYTLGAREQQSLW